MEQAQAMSRLLHELLQTMIQACIATKEQDGHPEKSHSHPPVSEAIP